MMLLKMKLTILILLISASLKAPSYPAIVIPAGEVINGYEAIWKAICQVESSGNRFAIGDKHLKEKSYGIVQLRQVKLDWYYKRTGIKYSIKDCYKVSVSKEIFMYHMNQYSDVDEAIKKWNGSGKQTYIYLAKVKKELLSL